MMDVGDTTEDSFIWSEELEQLGHRIARDCDEAFQSSLLLSESGDVGDESREASPFMLSLGTLPATRLSEPSASASGARPWDNRPLPPVPSQDTVSPLSIRKCSQGTEPTSQASKPYKLYSRLDVPIPERRTVSEPVYERLSKDTRPLPSIHEHAPDEWMRRKDVTPNPLETPTRAKNKGLDFLARAENTIRVVNSPSAIGADYPVKIPEPLNVRKVSQKTGATNPALAPAVNDATQRHTSYVSHLKSQSTEGVDCDAAAPSKKRVSSWFRRVSRESASSSSFATATDSSAQTKETCAESETSHYSQPTSQSTDDGSTRRAQKKKSFGFAFWKGSKDDLKMSLAGKHAAHPILTTLVC
jgi:hypothetical protein